MIKHQNLPLEITTVLEYIHMSLENYNNYNKIIISKSSYITK